MVEQPRLSTPPQLRGVSCNIQGLKNRPDKIKHLHELSVSENICMFLCCETWLDSTVFDKEINIPGFNLFRSDRIGRIRGGCAIYIDNKFCVDKARCLTFSNGVCEVTALIIEELDIALICFYRPPNTQYANFNEALTQVKLWYTKNCFDNTHVMFFGDFNFPWVSWQKYELSENAISYSIKPGSTTEQKKQFKELYSFMSSNFLFQTVHEPTNGCNTLGLQFINSDIFSYPFVMPTSFSDHDFLCWDVNIATVNSSDTIKADYDPNCFSSYNLAYDKVQWEDISAFLEKELGNLDTSQSTEGQLSFFYETCIESLKRHAPLKAKRKHYKAIPNDRKAYMKRRSKLRKKIEHCSNQRKKDKFRKEIFALERNIKDSIFKERCSAENFAVSRIKSNPKSFYTYARDGSRTLKLRGC